MPVQRALELLKAEEALKRSPTHSNIISAAKSFKLILNQLSNELANEIDNNVEIRKLISVLLASSIRIMSMYVEPSNGFSSELGTVGATLSLIKTLLTYFTKNKWNLHDDDDNKIVNECLVKLNQLFLMTIVLLGWLCNPTISIKLDSDIEYTTLIALDVYKLGIKSLQISSKGQATYLQISSGPVLAQMISSTLALSKHRSKELANSALLLLSEIMLTSMRPDTISNWRTFFPGLFSALFTISTGDYKKGSQLRSNALYCLLHATAFITNDNAIDNTPLINIENDNEKEDAIKMFDTLISKVNTDSSGNSNSNSTSKITSSVASDANSKLKAQPDSRGMPLTIVSTEWRVDLLQKLQSCIPTAWNTVFSSTSLNFQCKFIRELGQLVTNSALFFGLPNAEAGHSLLILLIRQQSHQNKDIQQSTREAWDALNKRVSISSRRELKSFLLNEMTNGLAAASRSVQQATTRGDNDNKLLLELERTVGSLATILNSKDIANTSLMLRSTWSNTSNDKKNTINHLLNLLLPVLDGGTPSVGGGIGMDYGIYARLLRMRHSTYAGITKETITVGYLGVANRLEIVHGKEGDWITRAVRQICYLFGQCGLTSLLLDAIRSSKRSTSGEGNPEIEIATWRALNFAIVGTSASSAELHDPDVLLANQVIEEVASDKKKSSLFDETSNDQFDEKSNLYLTICREAISTMHKFIEWQTNRVVKVARNRLLDQNTRTKEVNVDALLATSTRTLSLSSPTKEADHSIDNLLRALATANAIEALITTATMMGSNFQTVLSEALFPLLQLAGDVDSIVSTTAESSLKRLAFIMGHKDGPAELIRVNLDYITSSLSTAFGSIQLPKTQMSQEIIKLQNYDVDDEMMVAEVAMAAERTRLAFIIDVVFRSLPEEGKDSKTARAPLALSRELVSDLLEAIDSLGSTKIVPKGLLLMINHAMQALLVCAAKPTQKLKQIPAANRFYLAGQASTNARRLLGINDKVDSASDDNGSTQKQSQPEVKQNVKDSDDDDDAEDHEDDGPKEPTLSQKLVLDVLERCMALLAVAAAPIQVQVIDTIGAGLLRLSEDRRQLLPAVHRVWTPIILRLKEQVLLAVSARSEASNVFVTFDDLPSSVAKAEGRVRIKSHDTSLLNLEQKEKNEVSLQDRLRVDITSKPKSPSASGAVGKSLREFRRQEMKQMAPPVLLSHLFDYIALNARLCGDFLVFKFKEEIWNEAKTLLQHIYCNSLAFLFSNENNKMLDNSLISSWQIALFTCLNNFSELKETHNYFVVFGDSIAWLLLPCLTSVQNQKVFDAAVELMKSLLSMNKSLREILLSVLSSDLEKINNDANILRAITSGFKFEGPVVTKKIPEIEKILKALNMDTTFNDTINMLLNFI